MSDYMKRLRLEDSAHPSVQVLLQAGDPKVLALGQKLEAICSDAYMNGYNWEALLRHYLETNAPELLEGMKTDPEADMYVAYWPLTPENEERARRFEELLRALVEDKEGLCRFVREHGEDVEWD